MQDELKTIDLELPPDLHEQASTVSEVHQVSLNDFIVDAVAEKLAAANSELQASDSVRDEPF
jgi:hypothetical protein